MMKFEIGFVPFNVVEAMVYLLLIVYVVKEGFYGGICTRLKGRCFRFILPVSALILGSLGGLYISYLYGDIEQALGIFKGWVIMPVIYVILLLLVFKKIKDKKLSLNFYMLSAMWLSLWALYQVVSGDYITIDQRASGPFESANYLALYVAPAVVLAGLKLWQRAEDTFWKSLWGKFKDLFKRGNGEFYWAWVAFDVFGFVVCMAAILCSKSYGAILGVLGALFIYAIYELFFSDFKNKYGKVWHKLLVVLVVVVISGLAIVSQVGTSKFDDFLAFDRQSSSSVRVQVWTVAGKLIEENPFMGIGLGGYERVYEERALELLGAEPYEKEMLHPHNLVLATWLNSGLVGAVAISWLIVAVFWSIRRKELDYDQKRFVAIVLTMFIVICIHGFVDQPFWKNDLALLWWLVVGSVI